MLEASLPCVRVHVLCCVQALAARDRDGTGYVSVDDLCTVMSQYNVFLDRVSASAAIRQQGVHIDQYDKLNYKQLLSQLNSGAATGLISIDAM